MQNFQLSRDSHMGGYKNKRIKRPKNPRPLLHSIHNYTFNKKTYCGCFPLQRQSLLWSDYSLQEKLEASQSLLMSIKPAKVQM